MFEKLIKFHWSTIVVLGQRGISRGSHGLGFECIPSLEASESPQNMHVPLIYVIKCGGILKYP
jgi:hypothetical protein